MITHQALEAKNTTKPTPYAQAACPVADSKASPIATLLPHAHW